MKDNTQAIIPSVGTKPTPTLPCQQCPWLSKDQRDKDALTPETRKAAKDGKWFCCHVNLGTCYGAVRFGAALQMSSSQQELINV